MIGSQDGLAPERVCFVFVCQQGELEAKAVLLAASLRRHLPRTHDLVAALPTPESRWGRPAPETLTALERLSVRTAEIINRVSPDYPIGNKLDCLAVKTDCQRLVFLDTDMLLLRPVDLAPLADARLAATPASHAHVEADDWARFYRACGLPPPRLAMRTLLSDESTPPYFNAGFISVEAGLAADLADAWSHCAGTLLADDLPPRVRRRFLDQVSLPLAAARLGLEIQSLAATWNFPSWDLKIGDGPLPAFYHYQQLGRLLEESATRVAFRQLLSAAPDVGELFHRTFSSPVGEGAN